MTESSLWERLVAFKGSLCEAYGCAYLNLGVAVVLLLAHLFIQSRKQGKIQEGGNGEPLLEKDLKQATSS